MVDFIIAMAAILLFLGGWILVQEKSREFARRHPEFGPAREEGGGCGTSCLCSKGGSCRKRTQEQMQEQPDFNHNLEDRHS
jgi:hypothetical protein